MGKKSCDMLSSGHAMAFALTKSIQLCLPAQEQTEKISQHSNRQQQLNSVGCL